MIAAPIFALVSKYIPATKTIALGLGVYFGKGAIWNIAKLGITIFCPLLTPLLMLLGWLIWLLKIYIKRYKRILKLIRILNGFNKSIMPLLMYSYALNSLIH